MKVLLMVPLPSLLRDPPLFPDLGLAYLARALLDAGHEVRFLDWANAAMSLDSFADWLREEQPEVVGIKFFTKDIRGAKSCAGTVRRQLPEAPILIGGPHPSAQSPKRLMAEFPEADYAIQGDAERSLSLLLDRISQPAGAELGSIPGLVYRENGAVRSSPPAFGTHPDEYGIPPWDLIDPTRYRSCYVGTKGNPSFMAPIVVSRGCPARCNFCTAARSNGAKVRHRSLDHVMGEIELLHGRYGVRQLMITDANFTYDKGFIVLLCEEIIRRGIDISFNCPTGTSLDTLDDETLPLLKRAGCHFIGLGIESAAPRIRGQIGKGIDLIQIRQTVKRINRHGISVPGYFMLGFPDESREEMEETVRFAFAEPFLYRAFEIVYPLPGTAILDYLLKRHSLTHVDFAEFDIYRSPYPMSRLSTDELQRVFRRARLRVKLTPSYLLSSLKRKVAAFTLMD